MSDRIIFHIDVNSAFLSWEATYRVNILGETEDLREIPSAVGGDIEKRKGIILAKSIPAKKYHIQTGEPIIAALEKCPHLKIVKPNFNLYTSCSKAFMSILEEYSTIVEQYSIDEAYMDMTGTSRLYGSPVAVAHVIKDRIYKELGFTVNIGISSNKLLAKMAGDLKKPNLVHTLFPNEIEEKMWPLPVGDLFFVGRKTEKKLKLLGIKTIGDLAKTDPGLLKAHFKKHGEIIYQYANGMGEVEISTEKEPNKGYGNSTTIPYDISTVDAAKLVLLSLCETVCTRLRADHVKAGCISVSIVNNEFEHESHQKVFASATNVTQEVYERACYVFEELWDHVTPIRHLGVHTSKLTEDNAYQYNIFDMYKYDKHKKLDAAVDSIRNKYGSDSIIRAPFLTSNIDHMSGGSSKERKTGIIKFR